MKIYRIRDCEEYSKHVSEMNQEYVRYKNFEDGLIPLWKRNFRVGGYSYVADRSVNFTVDYINTIEGRVNWRETVQCPITGFNNRMRATLHILDTEIPPYPEDIIYVSEQATPFYKLLASKYKNVVGSEYLGDKVKLGELNGQGIRNESLSQLTFTNESFDRVISLDCLEHFPDHKLAFIECYRVLKPGGKMLWSLPFSPNSEVNITRARIRDDGSIEHLFEPEYHGDPLSKDGCLCFTYFGWEMLDKVKESGFSDAYAVLYWSDKFGYLGGEQMLFVAHK